MMKHDREELIHFSGTLRASAKEVLRQAVEGIETRLSLKSVPREIGRPWVIVASSVPPRGVCYMAHRLGYSAFFTAWSVDELAQQIHAFGSRPERRRVEPMRNVLSANVGPR